MKKAAFLFFRVEVGNAACAVQYLVVVQTMLVRCPKNLDFTVFQKVSLSNLIFRAGVIVAVPLHEVNAAPNAKSCAKRDYQSLQYVNCAVEKIHINLAFCR